MSANGTHSYRFASQEQWQAGLGARIDTDRFRTQATLAPLLPFPAAGTLFATPGAWAPAARRDGTLYWRDSEGRLHTLAPDGSAPAKSIAPAALAHARRIAVTRRNLWAASPTGDALECYDSEYLVRRFVVALDEARVLDLAQDGRDGVWALVAGAGGYDAVHIDCAGYQVARIGLDAVQDASQLTFLAHSGRLVVLAAGKTRLHWFDAGRESAPFMTAIDALRPCMAVAALGGDGRSRVLLAGTEHDTFGGGNLALSVDAEGSTLAALPLPEPATGIDAHGNVLLVSTAQGLLRFEQEAQAGASAETSCVFMTPALTSPLNDNPRRWLRAEARLTLPPGTSVEIRHAASADPAVHAKALRIAAGPAPASHKMAHLREHLHDWSEPMVATGSAGAHGSRPVSVEVPLFDVHAPWLWISVTLVAAPGAAMPALHRLDVFYPGATLMEYLPALYQRAEAEPGNFLRALVGVIETDSQELDRRIAAMGSMIHPRTAPGAWLDYVARWLGLPWDDALGEAQKRALLARANDLAALRGTRAGLEILLDALLPGGPRRYRLTDHTAQHGFVTLGGAAAHGSALPAVLAGLPSSALALNRRAVLGRGRLPCAGRLPDPTAHLAGRVTLHVAADGAQRAAWQPWLERLVADVMPVTARLRLRWHAPAHLRSDRLGEDFILAGPPSTRLGADAIAGLSRLPGDGEQRLGPDGMETGATLR